MKILSKSGAGVASRLNSPPQREGTCTTPARNWIFSGLDGALHRTHSHHDEELRSPLVEIDLWVHCHHPLRSTVFNRGEIETQLLADFRNADQYRKPVRLDPLVLDLQCEVGVEAIATAHVESKGPVGSRLRRSFRDTAIRGVDEGSHGLIDTVCEARVRERRAHSQVEPLAGVDVHVDFVLGPYRRRHRHPEHEDDPCEPMKQR